ncbi:MAG: thioesterase family protein [Prevotellaceae bacterium]|nr:thioesterase family protein [Prevotellaceae bacterium]
MDIQFHHNFPLQVRFFDADVFGHINNSIYFQYYDTAKMDYFHAIGVDVDKNHATVTAHIDADFLQQIHTTDKHIEVQTAVTHIGHKSFTLVQRLIDSETKEVKCVGTSIIVAYDLEKEQSVEVWPDWIAAIEKFEGRSLR